MSNLIRGISENGGVVFCGVDSTDIVRKATSKRNLSMFTKEIALKAKLSR